MHRYIVSFSLKIFFIFSVENFLLVVRVRQDGKATDNDADSSDNEDEEEDEDSDEDDDLSEKERTSGYLVFYKITYFV